MRVLHVIASMSSSTGGPAAFTALLAKSLQDAGHEIVLMTTDAGGAAQTRDPGTRVAVKDLSGDLASVDIRLHKQQTPYRLTYSSELARALNKEVHRYDLVHIHGLYLHPTFAAWQAARKNSIPYVVSPHGSLSPWILNRGRIQKTIMDALWQRRMLHEAGAIHVTTEVELDQVKPLGLKSPLRVVPNGLDVARFARDPRRSSFRARFLDGYEGPLILNHGRISYVKGLDILVEAFSQIAHDAEPRLVMIGADKEGHGERLRQIALEQGVGHLISFLEELSGADLVEAIQAADIWVLPSHSENFGLAVAEAMAAGKPVVTSPHVNMAPLAARDGALLMVPNGKSEVADAIKFLLENPTARENLGRSASEYVQRYDWSHVVQQFVDLYETVISEQKSTGGNSI